MTAILRGVLCKRLLSPIHKSYRLKYILLFFIPINYAFVKANCQVWDAKEKAKIWNLHTGTLRQWTKSFQLSISHISHKFSQRQW